MSIGQENEQSDVPYSEMKVMIDETFPRGWFVAVNNGQSVAAAATFQELERILRAQGKDPRTTLVIEAGADYPDYVTIFV